MYRYNYLKSHLTGNMTLEDYWSLRDHIYADFSYMHVNDIGCMEFAGVIPGNLRGDKQFLYYCRVVARQQRFDIIHAHDWLTYPAGVHAKMVSGKPTCIRPCHRLQPFARKSQPNRICVEKNGMDYADCIVMLLPNLPSHGHQ